MKHRRLPLHRKCIYSAIVVAGFFGFLELGLRAINVGNPPIVGKLQFGYDTGVPIYDSDGIESEGVVYEQVPLFERDSELFWRPIANTPFTGPHGFRLPEPDAQTDSDETLTIVVLGDSCSFLGQSTYPARLSKLLPDKLQRSVRVFNASCPGYSSAQGDLRLKQLADLKPDLVIVYFGWNDHWRSLNGCTDRELIVQNKFVRRTQSVLRHFHFYWLVYSLVAPVPRVRVSPNAPVRVPEEDYVSNLTSIAQQATQWNSRVLFLTAPTCFEMGKLPEWAGDFFGQFYHMTPEQVQNIPKVHQAYNDRVRELAKSLKHCELVDLDSALSHQPTLFRSDCIHLTEEGHQQVAALIAQHINP